MSGKEIRVNPGSRLNGWHGYASVLCTVSLQQYHARAEGVALGHRCRKSQSHPIYQLCLLKGRADAALDFYFTDLTPGFMGHIQPHIAGHHLNKYLSCWKGPGRRAACLAPCSPSSLSQLRAGSLTVTRRAHPSILHCYGWAGERSLPGTHIHQFSSRRSALPASAVPRGTQGFAGNLKPSADLLLPGPGHPASVAAVQTVHGEKSWLAPLRNVWCFPGCPGTAAYASAVACP